MTLLFPEAQPQTRSLSNEESHSINHILFQHQVLNTIQLAAPTLAFSGAQSASELNERGYLRDMLSRRQLQGFVMCALELKSESYASTELQVVFCLGRSFDDGP